jgi:hypothetical protein
VCQIARAQVWLIIQSLDIIRPRITKMHYLMLIRIS